MFKNLLILMLINLTESHIYSMHVFNIFNGTFRELGIKNIKLFNMCFIFILIYKPLNENWFFKYY